MWERQFVLDFDKIHIGRAEEFQVFVNRCLALMVGAIEMQEKSCRHVVRGGFVLYQAEHRIAFVHSHQPFFLKSDLPRGAFHQRGSAHWERCPVHELNHNGAG